MTFKMIAVEKQQFESAVNKPNILPHTVYDLSLSVVHIHLKKTISYKISQKLQLSRLIKYSL